MLCASCASYNSYNLPDQDEVSFSPSGQYPIYYKWWRYLEDENLNTHIEPALENNFTLAAALEHLNMARTITWREAFEQIELGYFNGAS